MNLLQRWDIQKLKKYIQRNWRYTALNLLVTIVKFVRKVSLKAYLIKVFLDTAHTKLYHMNQINNQV